MVTNKKKTKKKRKAPKKKTKKPAAPSITPEEFFGSVEAKPEYVKLNRLPVVFGRRAWELMARGYTTAEAMGVADEGEA